MSARNGVKQSLKEYRAKRNFKKTPEPTGDSPTRAGADRKSHFFCVQKHLASHLHYDFRLEHHGVLLSWAVPKGPSLNPRDKRLAMRVEDHPRDYGEFEGVIPEGYGAGIVMLWDKGAWTPESPDIDAALKSGELKFSLDGVKLKGSWVLVRTGGGRFGSGRTGPDGESRTWLMIKHRDAWAGEVDVTEAAPLSVKSFNDFEHILAADKPDVWQSHLPAKGGETGQMLREIIDRAAALKLKQTKGKTGAGGKSKPVAMKAVAPKVKAAKAKAVAPKRAKKPASKQPVARGPRASRSK